MTGHDLDLIATRAGSHRAIVECCYPPSIDLVASGPHRWCVDRLVEWTEKHPTSQWSRAYVVAVTDEVICEPGVGVYTVPADSAESQPVSQSPHWWTLNICCEHMQPEPTPEGGPQ